MEINFTAPPTCGRMMESEAFARFITGPVGSGKTTAMIMEMLRRAAQQRPGPDGIRRTRWAIVRQTLEQLKMTVLLDILNWLRPIATYRVADKLIIIRFADIHSEWYMVPLEDPEDQRRLLSMQLTGAFLSEAIEMSADLVPAISGRCGRYPSAADGGCTWFGLIGDTNAPTEGSDWHRLFEDDKPPDWQVFHQPSGLSAEAENLNYLLQTPTTLALPLDHPDRLAQGRTYYERLARGHNSDWIKRYVHGEYGDDPGGTAVWRGSYKRSFHVKRGLEPVPGFPLIIAQDFGRHPCSLITQPDHAGRLAVLEEVIAEDIGLELHVTKSLRPRLFTERYAGLRYAAVGDPSGVAKGNFLEETSFDVLARLGIPAFPAPTNSVDPRILAVETLFLQQRDGGPALVIDEDRCPNLIRAVGGAYRFAKNMAGETKPLPEKKHPWSDVADCLQYAALVVNSGLTNVISKRIKPKSEKPRSSRVTAAGWT